MNLKKYLIAAGIGTFLSAHLAGGEVPALRLNPTGPPSTLRLSSQRVSSLNGVWWLAVDPHNIGRKQGWFRGPTPGAKPAKVPWIIQDAFPAYHGVAWYWRDFVPAPNPWKEGRFLLRFWGVDFSADVWLNGVFIGRHEGGEIPFVIDVTDTLKINAPNRLAVRVVNPTHQPIDGLTLSQTPHQARVIPYSAGAEYDCGGITDSVELLAVPEVYIADLYAAPDVARRVIQAQVTIVNSSDRIRRSAVEFSVAPAAGGEVLLRQGQPCDLGEGTNLVKAELRIEHPHLWDINDPFLYRVTARARTGSAVDAYSVNCGFRDFRFAKGFFRLNGRRIFLRSTHTCNNFPIGQRLPYDPDLARRDLLDVKAMGFNTIRFIWGGALRYQLDLCDQLGLMVYEESFASSPLADSPQMAALFDHSVGGLIRRDRNHPSVVIWGLLNESGNGPAFQHAVRMLPFVRSLDNQRMVFLNAGRYDGLSGNGQGPFAQVALWHSPLGREPWVVYNPQARPIETPFAFSWPPRRVCLHPGEHGEFSVARWIAPQSGLCDLRAQFMGMPSTPATTDVHVLLNGQPLFGSGINIEGKANTARYAGQRRVARGDVIDFVVGYGNGNYGSDTTSLAASLRFASGASYSVAGDFSAKQNPAGPWRYGYFKPGSAPDWKTFTLYAETGKSKLIGSIANPGSIHWQNLLTDLHYYPRVPHTAATIRQMRTMHGALPIFMSEYGIGSAVDLWRVTRHFEQLDKTETEDARFYRDKLNRFLADWRRWKLDEVWARPEDFFAASLRKMAGQRTLGLTAIRANPNIIGYSLTGMNDHVSCGEGLTTTFREFKPGTVDALFEGLAPLRWCLFVEPLNVYAGGKVRLHVILANEDALRPGEYPARVQIIGPDNYRAWERTVTFKVPAAKSGHEPPLAFPVLKEEITVRGPPGKYRLLATLERGGAPTCGQTEFYVADPARMPQVGRTVVLWGKDAGLRAWLVAHQIPIRNFAPSGNGRRQVILAGLKPPTDVAAGFRKLARRMARGSTVIFLCPEVFQKGKDAVGWLPLAKKGALTPIRGWLYLKDEWAKRHPIFDGLPCGGLMDYTYYREIIPDLVWRGQDPPEEAVAGAIKASQDYSSGLMVSVYRFGAGRFILNTLRLRQNLGTHPAAERLLRNLLRYAALETHAPPALLPGHFATRLKAIGYE